MHSESGARELKLKGKLLKWCSSGGMHAITTTCHFVLSHRFKYPFYKLTAYTVKAALES